MPSAAPKPALAASCQAGIRSSQSFMTCFFK